MTNHLNVFRLQQLPKDYLTTANQAYSSLIKKIIQLSKTNKKTIFVSINGCQGSGKTTLAQYLSEQLSQLHSLNAVTCSLDDFYLDQNHRHQLAQSIHPLLKTRGVPGTHNINLLKQTFKNFSDKKVGWLLTKFDKTTDNPFDRSHWQPINFPVDVAIIEGWCWGVPAQRPDELAVPINSLEKEYDKNGIWRHYVNQQIIDNYQVLYQQIDLSVMLKAPSFDCVHQWRLEQEQNLSLTSNGSLMTEQEIAKFIQYFQRLTEQALKVLPQRVDFLFELDKNRQITQSMSK